MRCSRGVLGPWLSTIAGAMLVSSIAHADGGVTADARREGDRRATAFIAPVVPRVGAIDVSVLLTPQPAAADDLQTIVRAVHTESGLERSASARPAHQGNRLLRSALLELPRPGRWRIEVSSMVQDPPSSMVTQATTEPKSILGSQSPARWPTLVFDVDVAPPLPSWRSQWPWLLAWIPLAALLLLRERLVMGQRDGPSTIVS